MNFRSPNIFRRLFILLLLAQWLLGFAAVGENVALDNQGRPLWVEGVIWLKLKPATPVNPDQFEISSFNIPSLDSKIQAYGIQRITRIFRPLPHPELKNLPDLTRIFTLELPANASAWGMLAVFNSDPNVEYAERVPATYPDAVPNDEFYADLLHHLPQIQAEQAWDIHKGEDGVEEIIVGICDTGVDWKHPDLAANIYNRLGEDADGDSVTMVWDGTEWVMDPDDLNGIDDDNNGYVDDLIGWNMMADPEGNQNNNPMDPPNRGHGSHCAGLAAGVTNNSIGISSISWNVKLLATSHSYPEAGGQYISRGYSGLVYLADNGADIISASWGGGGYSRTAEEVIRYISAVGSIFVSSAGNEDDLNGMRGFGPRYPAAYPGCISVAAVNIDDAKAWYSSFGWYVDVSAPGGNGILGNEIYSTVPGGYAYISGTSMAGPLAAGLFALVKSYHPDWSNDQIINQVLGTTDDIYSINPFYTNWLGSGRINAYRSLAEENVQAANQMKLVLWDEENSNPAAEDWELKPGQSTDIGFTLRNYSHLVGDSSVSFTLHTNSPQILIQNPSFQDTIFPDDFFSTESVHLEVAEDAYTELARVWLNIEPQNAEVITGDSLNFNLLVNSTSLATSFLDLELNVGELDTSLVSIHNSAAIPVIMTASSSAIDPSSLLWHVSENQAYEGSSWWCGDPNIGGYPNATVQYLELPSIDLTSTSNPQLSFMLDWDIEDPIGADSPFDGWDGANVWISTDQGETFEVIEPISPAYTCTALYAWGDFWEMGVVPGWAGNHHGYEEAHFNLNAFASSEVIIRFGFAADAAETGTGVFIDNIRIHEGTDILYENTGVFEGGIRVEGFPSEIIPTPWVSFPNGNNIIPGNGDLDLLVVTNPEGLEPGFYSTVGQVLYAGHILGEFDINLTLSAPTTIGDIELLPQNFSLSQNYPNPFNPSTHLDYALAQDVHVKIQIFDLQGRLVSQPVNRQQSAGYYSLEWQARDLQGEVLGTSLYFARIQAGAFSKVIRMVYLK